MKDDAIVIAIDGPSASGKSSVARGVAKTLDMSYVDSGSLYRGVTWKILKTGVDPSDERAVARCVKRADWEFYIVDGGILFAIDGESPGAELRSKKVRETVSDIAALESVRSFVTGHLRALMEFGALVVEGRDIGTTVFPGTGFKFYLDANPEIRAQRRYREFKERGEADKAQEVLESIQKRDQKDSSRAVAPLEIAPGAFVVDSTAMSLAEVEECVLERCTYLMKRDPEQLNELPVYFIASIAVRFFLQLWNRLSVRGAENIPAVGGALIASNHTSFLDPPAIVSGCRSRVVRFLARSSLLSNPLAKWFFTSGGIIPIARFKADTRALKITLKALNDGRVVAMFPEGTRSTDGELKKPKKGIGFLAVRARVPVVPTFIKGAYAAFPKGGKWIKPAPVSISFGRPIMPSEFESLGSGREAYSAASNLLMERIAELKAQSESE